MSEHIGFNKLYSIVGGLLFRAANIISALQCPWASVAESFDSRVIFDISFVFVYIPE